MKQWISLINIIISGVRMKNNIQINEKETIPYTYLNDANQFIRGYRYKNFRIETHTTPDQILRRELKKYVRTNSRYT